jgi:Asp-tRNA(Asn)/Glu-tRNA(Gln) amidotransferase C subunit
MNRVTKLCAIVGLSDNDAKIHAQIDKIVDVLIDKIYQADLDAEYPIWLGVKGPKPLRKDISKEGDPTLIAQVCKHSHENFVLAPKSFTAKENK